MEDEDSLACCSKMISFQISIQDGIFSDKQNFHRLSQSQPHRGSSNSFKPDLISHCPRLSQWNYSKQHKHKLHQSEWTNDKILWNKTNLATCFVLFWEHNFFSCSIPESIIWSGVHFYINQLAWNNPHPNAISAAHP